MIEAFRAASIVAAAGLTLALLGLASPANAERYSVDDPPTPRPRSTTSSVSPWPTASSGSGSRSGSTTCAGLLGRRQLFLDTDFGDKDLSTRSDRAVRGTDDALTKVEGWRGIGGAPLHCKYNLRLRYKADVVSGGSPAAASTSRPRCGRR